jgi:hypothetical protein
VVAEHELSIPITGFGDVATDTTDGEDETAGDPSGPSTSPGDTTTDSTGGTDTASSDDGGGGCGCTTSSPADQPGRWLLLAPLLLLRRRTAQPLGAIR